VVRVVSVFEGDSVTGPAKNLLEFASRARSGGADLRLEFSLVTYRRTGDPPENALMAAARAAGIPVEVVTERGRFDPGVLPQLRRLVEERNPDIVQTHHVKSHFLTRLSGLPRRRLWLAFHHGYTRVDLKMRIYNQLDRWSLRGADHVVTVCQAFVRQLEGRGVPAERITAQHNCVNPEAAADGEEAARIRQKLGLPPGAAVLLAVGRLSPEKGHRDLLRALAELRRRWPGEDFRLVIVGEGKERGRMEAMRRQYNLEDQVHLAGHQHDVRPYYAAADAVVIPSHTEGSPNVLLEAMAYGRAVVATRVGGIPEIVQDGKTALLTPPGEPAAMAEALRKVLTSPEERQRLAAAARDVVQSRFTPEAYHRSLLEVYRRLWERSRGRFALAG